MELRPILVAMRRNKVGAIIIAVQIAITLAILCNGLFIVEQQITLSERPTGADESNVFVISNQWVGDPPNLSALLQADLAGLRTLPGVIDAFASNSFPLSNSGTSGGIKLTPDQKEPTAQTAVYFADEHALQSLGLNLIAGRNFNSDEIADKVGFNDLTPPASVIITKALAEKLFPGKSALGQSIIMQPENHTIRIIGIVGRLQVPWVESWSTKFNDNSILEPFRLVAPYVLYIVRTQPGQLRTVLKTAEKKLFDLNRGRIMERSRSLTDARVEVYRDHRGLAVILGVVCAALVVVTAFGIVGLTSYWVAQRRRQIGIRRALGATRHAIIQYFQTENLLIAGAGAAIGVALALSLNLWMVNAFAMQRLHTSYALVGAIVVMILGQAAVLWPAFKAASIPPALATRAA
ncbi:MAG: ABC transporter permease [Pseudomonadota bacterium]|nr:ABC transporter permease [Pseudomonadota bacterium]